MANILFVNACVRGEQSRTLKIARRFLEVYAQRHPEDTVTERNLMVQRQEPQYPEVLAQRDAAWEAGALDSPLFEEARQFASADKIVVAAPFWELSFPAILKIYLERVSVNKITFGYDNAGGDVGLCKADKLLFITTRGGNFTAPDKEWMEIGARELKALCVMYGIGEFQLLCAEGLDDVRNDAAALVAEALERAGTLAEQF